MTDQTSALSICEEFFPRLLWSEKNGVLVGQVLGGCVTAVYSERAGGFWTVTILGVGNLGQVVDRELIKALKNAKDGLERRQANIAAILSKEARHES